MINTMKTKKLRLLKETIDYYSVNPKERRCINYNGVCTYSPITSDKPNSAGCAIGRLISTELQLSLDRDSPLSLIHVFHRLPLDIREYGVSFLQNIQELHDTKLYWNDEGLTDSGKYKVEAIRNTLITNT